MRKVVVLLLALFAVQLGAQDMTHYKRIVKELSSARYQGRGYAHGGANKAGKYLERQYRKAGANDNASGTAALVTLAAYYAKNRPAYDMYFLSVSGEDANLRGSEYFAQHPIFPLEQIKYLFNLDMIGDNNPVQYCEVSDPGMRGFALFEQINGEQHYFQALNRGELAANSDHYPFASRGVPCIFLENEDGDAFPWYHTIYDTWKNAVFDSYEPVFKLVCDFIARY